MQKHYTAIIAKDQSWYVARCIDLVVTSQGRTVEEAKTNLKEAVDLYITCRGATPVAPVPNVL